MRKEEKKKRFFQVLREDLGLTRREMAAMLSISDVSKESVYSYESSNANNSFSPNILVLANLLLLFDIVKIGPLNVMDIIIEIKESRSFKRQKKIK